MKFTLMKVFSLLQGIYGRNSCAWYAQISKDTPTGEKVWYLPQHGVYHPAKPNKIQVVFDCSTGYVGRSINKVLISLIKLLVP